MENKEALNTLNDIRNIMEKSTRFLSLSGVSSILVGIYACIGTGIAYAILAKHDVSTSIFTIPLLNVNTPYKLTLISILAIIILIVCLVTVFFMSYRKAKRAHQNIFLDRTARRLLVSFFLPLLAGGIFCISLLWHQYYGLTSSVMLLFYGMSLVNSSKYTYSNTRYLGYAEIVLGLMDSFVANYALVFWVIGFGIFHILYGILFYINIERPRTHPS